MHMMAFVRDDRSLVILRQGVCGAGHAHERKAHTLTLTNVWSCSLDFFSSSLVMHLCVNCFVFQVYADKMYALGLFMCYVMLLTRVIIVLFSLWSAILDNFISHDTGNTATSMRLFR